MIGTGTMTSLPPGGSAVQAPPESPLPIVPSIDGYPATRAGMREEPMAWHPMKPETVARRAVERSKAREASRADLRARLAAKALRDGPGSLFADLLAEHDARVAAEAK